MIGMMISTKTDELYIGIDEAGRGPVVGSMFIAAVALNKQQKDFLKSIGVKDSKLLSPTTRKKLKQEIIENCLAYKIKKVTPEEIDARIKAKTNINKLEAIKIAELINEFKNIILASKPKKITIYIDCPSNNIQKWKGFLLNYVDQTIKQVVKFVIQHHAERHVCVASASILAKEARENEVEKIKNIIGDFGSGYPSDPITMDFLKSEKEKIKELDKKYRFLRWSWITSKIIKEKEAKQKKLKDFF